MNPDWQQDVGRQRSLDAEALLVDLASLMDAGASPEALQRELAHYAAVPISEDIVREIDLRHEMLTNNRAIIATTDPLRSPRKGECVVLYGHYPPTYESLLFHQHVCRPVQEFWNTTIQFSRIESSSCWDAVDRIVYINRADRMDRAASLLRELSWMGAPLDRIHRFNALIPSGDLSRGLRGQIGCLSSHLEVCRQLRDEGMQNSLIIEDDFSFSNARNRIQVDMQAFFARRYAYDVCLLATSKHGAIEPFDDLVCLTRQPCTNTAAHFVSAAGLEKLIPCFEDALQKLRCSGDILSYAVDRCWSRLQGRGFLLFNRKMGFQISSYSDIEARHVNYLD